MARVLRIHCKFKRRFFSSTRSDPGAENTKLLKTVEELKKQIEELKAENASLKEQLSSSAATSDSDTPSSDSVSTTDNENDQRLLNAIIMCDDVTNGNGTDVIGQRAYIVIPKEVLSQISENGYATFLENKIKIVDITGFL